MDASGSGIEHLFHPGCAEWSEAVERYDAGYRWLDSKTGTFHRSAPRATHALTVARSAAPGGWRLPPRTLPQKDFLAAEPEHVPVDLLLTRSRPDAPTLKLGSSARCDLDNLAAESRGGAETGGFFYGHREGAEGPRVFVSQLARMVKDSTSDALRLDMVANVNHKGLLRAESDHLCELGAWHTHPNTYNGEPSETDLQTLVSGLDHAAGRKDLSRYFGVIVTPGRNCGWLVPDLHGWMVTRRSGRAVCERVKVS